MDTSFSHLLGDIRQPVLVLGADPDTDGNVLVAPFVTARSVPKADVYDAAVSSPTDTVDGAAERPGYDTSPTGTPQPGEAPASSPEAAQPTAPSGDETTHGQPADQGATQKTEAYGGVVVSGYTDNGDGTWTRFADGARGTFGPDGFQTTSASTSGTEGVHWGGNG